jgi:hypothetical protein
VEGINKQRRGGMEIWEYRYLDGVRWGWIDIWGNIHHSRMDLEGSDRMDFGGGMENKKRKQGWIFGWEERTGHYRSREWMDM